MNKLIFILLLPLTTFGQDFVNSSEFNSKIAKGISVVEFWAEWNKSNETDFLDKLKDCNSYKLCIVKNSSVQKEYNVSAIPTIIIFDNGTEQNRFTPNIMMQLQATKKDVQSVINEITFNKFQ
jgi:thioredoxin-related protein